MSRLAQCGGAAVCASHVADHIGRRQGVALSVGAAKQDALAVHRRRAVRTRRKLWAVLVRVTSPMEMILRVAEREALLDKAQAAGTRKHRA